MRASPSCGLTRVWPHQNWWRSSLASPELVGDGVADQAQRIGAEQGEALEATQRRLGRGRVRGSSGGWG